MKCETVFYALGGVDIMNGNLIITGTITYAIRGRDILRKAGYKASIERNLKTNKRYGCGYGIAAFGDVNEIVRILNENSIKVLDVAPIV